MLADWPVVVGGMTEDEFCPVPPQAARAASVNTHAAVVARTVSRRLRPVRTSPARPNAEELKPNHRNNGISGLLRNAPTVGAAVLMLMVAVAAEPLRFSEAGAKLHCAFAGRFEQVKLTAPWNPDSGVTLRPTRAAWPGVTVTDAGFSARAISGDALVPPLVPDTDPVEPLDPFDPVEPLPELELPVKL